MVEPRSAESASTGSATAGSISAVSPLFDMVREVDVIVGVDGDLRRCSSMAPTLAAPPPGVNGSVLKESVQ